MPNQTRPYEPLTSQNAALVLVDHQVGLMTGVRDYSIGELKHNVVALAKAAKALKLPIVVTTTARDSMWGPTFPELVEALPGIEIIDRSSVNAFDDARVTRAIETTGRKKLIFAGISLEVCAAFPAITAIGRGFDAYVAVDASGTFSETKRQVGLLRMLQAGVIVSDYTTLMVEILKDNARPEAGEVYEAMDMGWAKLVGQIAHSYGIKHPDFQFELIEESFQARVSFLLCVVFAAMATAARTFGLVHGPFEDGCVWRRVRKRLPRRFPLA